MSEIIINGFSEEGLKVLVQQINRLLIKRQNIFTFSGEKEKPLALSISSKTILKDLLVFLNQENLLDVKDDLGGWHDTFKSLNVYLEYKAKSYFKDFSVSLIPILGD